MSRGATTMAALVLLALTAGCGAQASPRDLALAGERAVSDGSRPSDGARRDGAPAPQCLGTRYPGKATIDPDNPDFEDQSWSKAQVQAKFAEAKAQGSAAYRAYKAAREHTEVLFCAFCACGCELLEGHQSAVDCFKDMHGFG